jgi:hypothetical protein
MMKIFAFADFADSAPFFRIDQIFTAHKGQLGPAGISKPPPLNGLRLRLYILCNSVW